MSRYACANRSLLLLQMVPLSKTVPIGLRCLRGLHSDVVHESEQAHFDSLRMSSASFVEGVVLLYFPPSSTVKGRPCTEEDCRWLLKTITCQVQAPSTDSREQQTLDLPTPEIASFKLLQQCLYQVLTSNWLDDEKTTFEISVAV